MRIPAALALLVAGCTVGPSYTPPATPAPAQAWQGPTPAADRVPADTAPAPAPTPAVPGAAHMPPDLATWWKVLGDTLLDSLMVEAQAANLDLRQAVARIRQSRAQLNIIRSLRLPTVNAVGSVGYGKRVSDQGDLRAVAPPGGFQTSGLYELGLTAAWEVDVFGRVRRQVEAAGASYQATVEDYRDVQVSLLAEVASAYVEARTLQQRLVVAVANASVQRQTLALARDRFEAGVTSESDVFLATANLAATEAEIPSLEIALTLTRNRLAVLLGSDPASTGTFLDPAGPIPAPPVSVAMDVPADLLRQRPDIRAAERTLAARVAQVGATEALNYPTLALTGFVGVSALEPDELFGSGSTVWGVTLPLQWTAFDGGRVASQVEEADARSQAALASYQQTVLTAMQEVENALASYAGQRNRRDRLGEAFEAYRGALQLVQVQYETGVTDFQTVLDTERSVFAVQDALVTTEGQVVKDLIGLYRAMGGGWDVNAPVPD